MLVDQYTNFFVKQVVKTISICERLRDAICIRCGNDGKNDSEYPIAPANIKRHNTITVAATFKDGTLAPFSNYSRTLVDIAAPGVGIVSSYLVVIPCDEWYFTSSSL